MIVVEAASPTAVSPLLSHLDCSSRLVSRRVTRRHLDKAINSLTRSRKQADPYREQVFPYQMLRRPGEVEPEVVGIGQLLDQFFGIRGR